MAVCCKGIDAISDNLFTGMNQNTFSMGMIVRFRLMTGVIVLVGPMIARMVMRMIRSATAMHMVMVVPMRMVVGMFMSVFMYVFHVSVRMLMCVGMRMVVFMLVLMIMFSFHGNSSCSAGRKIMNRYMIWKFYVF